MRAPSFVMFGLLLAGCSMALTRPPEERVIAQAEEMVRARDYRGAQEAYRRALSDDPKNSSTDRILLGLARLYVTPENPGRDYRRAYESFDRLLTEFPQSALATEARAWRELLSTFLSQREEAEKTRQEVQRIRQEAEKARQETQRIQQDLERLKQIETELERQRRR